MPNHLASANSPYLLQHADNPVDWYPWVEAALERARQEDKPIFLSIGYSACHWCHVMAHESFEDPRIAEIMNSNFINIKVDREERPDLDSIYMNAVVAMSGNGGWPMSVFLTPQGEPFYGGTYFPPVRRYNMPSFEEVLLTIVRLWKDDRQSLLKSSQEVTDHLRKSQQIDMSVKRQLDPSAIEKAALRLAQSYDWNYGGWGQAPKFPQPMAIEFLLQRAAHGDSLAKDVAIHALQSMAVGGMYDVLGGGFARYSTDNYWLVPHFEKMLYDNAQLSRVYLYAYMLTKDTAYLEVTRSTLDFVRREMMSPSGGFYSSLDADSEGVEGKFYIWDYTEIVDTLRLWQARSALEDSFDWVDVFTSAYGVTPEGNFEGQNVLQRAMSDSELSDKYTLPVERISEMLKEMRQALFKKREKRIHPGIDDKALTSWNALMLRSFAEAARYLEEPGYLEIAQQNAAFLCSELLVDGKMCRSWRDGKAQHSAFLEDFAALILGLLALYQTDHRLMWYQVAHELTKEMIAGFEDPSGGFFDTSQAQAEWLLRPKDLQDNALPCGNSLASLALLEIAAFDEGGSWGEMAVSLFGVVEGLAVRYPIGFSNWLCAFNLDLNNMQQVALLSSRPDLSDLLQFERAVWDQFRPLTVLAASPYPPDPTAPPLLQGRNLLKQQTTAYLCQNFTCKLPVNSANELAAQLSAQS